LPAKCQRIGKIILKIDIDDIDAIRTKLRRLGYFLLNQLGLCIFIQLSYIIRVERLALQMELSHECCRLISL